MTIMDGDITKGWIRERWVLKKFLGSSVYIPEPVFNYAKRISEFTGLPLNEVLQSHPVGNLIKRWSKMIEVHI